MAVMENDVLTALVTGDLEVRYLGGELCHDPTCDESGDWDDGTGSWSVSGGKLVHETSGTYEYITAEPTAGWAAIEAGITYEVTVSWKMTSFLSSIYVWIGGVSSLSKQTFNTVQEATFTLTAVNSDVFKIQAIQECEIYSVSIKGYTGSYGGPVDIYTDNESEYGGERTYKSLNQWKDSNGNDTYYYLWFLYDDDEDDGTGMWYLSDTIGSSAGAYWNTGSYLWPYTIWGDTLHPLASTSGTGTVTGTVLLSTKADMEDCADSPWWSGLTWALLNDIDMSGSLVASIGNQSNFFDGTFDGQGYKIKNLALEISLHAALFGRIEDAIIKNLHANVNITGAQTLMSAGMFGQGVNGNNVISDCSTSGTINVSGGTRVGGFCGQHQPSDTISNCWSSVDVIMSSAADCMVGGFVAHNNSEIIDCYASGSVTQVNGTGGAVSGAGGFAGRAGGGVGPGSFTRCHAVGAVSSNDAEGGFIGTKGNESNAYTDCYYNTDTTGQTDDSGEEGALAGVTGLTSGLFRAEMFFENWTFGPDANQEPANWRMTVDYPKLRWASDKPKPRVGRQRGYRRVL